MSNPFPAGTTEHDEWNRQDAAESAEQTPKPRIRVGTGPVTIRTLTEALNGEQIPGIYVSDGRLSHVEQVSGSAAAAAGDDDAPLPVAATALAPPSLAALLADRTYTYVRKIRRNDGEEIEEEVTPSRDALGAVLARRHWPKVRPLLGIVGAPVLRPDGTLLQAEGYDPATALYLARKVPLPPVPDKPTPEQVAAARAFLVEQLLRDFPWISDADRANYLALLVSPIVRPMLRCLMPFAVIDATMPGSGKTILTSATGMLYGQRVLSWTEQDEELRKALTSVLAEPVGVVVFDNIHEGHTIDSPILARLITERAWADRKLGSNQTVTFANDRLWCATGNNLRVGGDMASRTVLVRLDPAMPSPELRTGFAIPDLDRWILSPANQRTVLFHLLVLVLDWCRAGAPRQRGLVMRQFTAWAEALGGFLTHHGITEFLGNAGAVKDIDEQDARWTAFLSTWHSMYGDKHFTAQDLLDRAIPDASDRGHVAERWHGTFLTDHRGHLPSNIALGRKLTGHIGRYHGQWVLRSVPDTHTKVRWWWVEMWSPDTVVAPG